MLPGRQAGAWSRRQFNMEDLTSSRQRIERCGEQNYFLFLIQGLWKALTWLPAVVDNHLFILVAVRLQGGAVGCGVGSQEERQRSESLPKVFLRRVRRFSPTSTNSFKQGFCVTNGFEDVEDLWQHNKNTLIHFTDLNNAIQRHWLKLFIFKESEKCLPYIVPGLCDVDLSY